MHRPEQLHTRRRKKTDIVYKQYVPGAFSYVTDNRQTIKDAAAFLGISSTGVAAAIAKKHDAYLTLVGWKKLMNEALDRWVSASTHVAPDVAIRNEAALVTSLGLDQMLGTDLAKALKFVFPTLADVGIANFKVRSMQATPLG